MFMRRILFLFLALLAFTGTADEPRQTSLSARSSGPCVLLRNQNVLFGKARQQGQEVIVTRDDGTEFKLPRQEVMCWANSVRDLHQYRVDHRPKGNVRIHEDDARWCLKYGLNDLAAKEINTIYQLDPGNAVAIVLSNQLARALRPKALPDRDPLRPKALAVADPGMAQQEIQPLTKNSTHSKVQLASHAEPTKIDYPVDGQELRWFARHAQPVFLNRCVRCHDSSSDRKWKLSDPAIGSRPSTTMTNDNIVSTLRFVDRSQPLQSVIRSRATDGHGGIRGTLGTRNGSALQGLDNWLSNLKADRAGSLSKLKPSDAEFKPSASAAKSIPAGVKPIAKQAGSVRRLPEVANPFDPEIFNRRYHGNQGVKQALLEQPIK